MALTLNQILSRIRSLALSHRQIHEFYYGEPPEFDSQHDITYPACFVESQPGTVDRSARLVTYKFRVYLLDRVGVSEDTEGNETEVLSDMSSVAQDLLALLMNPIYQDDWIIDNTANIVQVTESLGDMVAGVIMDLNIAVDFLADSCQVPADDVEFETSFDMARTRVYNYDATGDEGNTIPVLALVDKAILAVFRAGQYKKATAVAPVSTETIQVGTVDLGTGKGIVGNGSAILQPGDSLVPEEILSFLYYA